MTGLSAQPRYLDRCSVAALEFFHTEQLAAQTYARVDALLFPQVESAPLTRLEPLAPSEALRRLAEQSVFFPLWRNHTAAQWRALSQLAAGVRSFIVLAGADVLNEPERVAEVLRAALS